MDYSKQDEADLRELIRRYRDGYSVSYAVEEVSSRWAKQGRLCDGEHVSFDGRPKPPGFQQSFDRYMATVRND